MTTPSFPDRAAIKAHRSQLCVLARNPETPPERLRRLAQNRAPGLREALATNPNTPLDVLSDLIQSVPTAFCRNPLAPLINIEDPAFVKRLSPLAVTALLRSPHPPLSLLVQIAGEPEYWGKSIALEVSQHIFMAGQIAEDQWLTAQSEAFIKAVWRNTKVLPTPQKSY